MQSELPAGFAGVAYEMSGWCFVEAAISAGEDGVAIQHRQP